MAIANLITSDISVSSASLIAFLTTEGLGSFNSGGTGLNASPSALTPGSTGNVVTLTGIGTSWTSGTPGTPTFTLTSTGSGASITAQVVNSTTSATLTISAGTAGVITLTDPSTGDTTTISVSVSSGIVAGFGFSVLSPTISNSLRP